MIPNDFDASISFMLVPEDFDLDKKYPKWQALLPNLPGMTWYEKIDFKWSVNNGKQMV